MSSQYIVYFEIIILIHQGFLISLTYTSDSPTYLFKKGQFQWTLWWGISFSLHRWRAPSVRREGFGRTSWHRLKRSV